jgi:hypothetical protein
LPSDDSADHRGQTALKSVMTDVLVMLGASGDMARRLLLPALYRLDSLGRLGHLRIVGYALDDWSTPHFQEEVRDGITDMALYDLENEVWLRFAERLAYRSEDLWSKNLASLGPFTEDNVVFAPWAARGCYRVHNLIGLTPASPPRLEPGEKGR